MVNGTPTMEKRIVHGPIVCLVVPHGIACRPGDIRHGTATRLLPLKHTDFLSDLEFRKLSLTCTAFEGEGSVSRKRRRRNSSLEEYAGNVSLGFLNCSYHSELSTLRLDNVAIFFPINYESHLNLR